MPINSVHKPLQLFFYILMLKENNILELMNYKNVVGITCLILTSLNVCAQSPDVLLKYSKEIVIGSGDVSIYVDSDEPYRRITDHIIAFDNRFQSTLTVKYGKAGEPKRTKTLLISDALSTSKVNINVHSREYYDDSMKIKGFVVSNLPKTVKSTLELTKNNVSVPLREDGYFETTVVSSTTLTAQVINNNFVMASSERTFNPENSEDWGCDFYLENNQLNALCFSDKQIIENLVFTLSDMPIGEFGKTTVGSEPESYVLHLIFKHSTRQVPVTIDGNQIDVQESKENDISDRLSALLRKPRQVY